MQEKQNYDIRESRKKDLNDLKYYTGETQKIYITLKVGNFMKINIFQFFYFIAHRTLF